MAALLEFTNKGIYCPPADVFIDPWRPVKRALITHGHSDHARWGHDLYVCTREARPVIRHRLGPVNIETVDFGESRMINGVRFSFHPAGHILGSAQIRVEYRGEVWVVSGDYKLENDGFSGVFEPIPCHAFITESTFGLPVYQWKPQDAVYAEINNWWRQNKEAGKVSVIAAYALGKAQRILQNLDPEIGPIFTHGAIENTNEVIREQGIALQKTIRITPELRKAGFAGGLVIAPPSAIGSSWLNQFKSVSTAVASGWMALRGTRRRRNADRGFALSDHADWDGLNQAIKATGAEQVIVTHGYTDTFARWLREQGLDAHAVQTEFEGEMLEAADTTENTETEQ